MNDIVIDTHAAIWYLFDAARLSQAARDSILLAEGSSGSVYLPSISVVEVRYLVEKGTVGEVVFRTLIDSLNDPQAPLTLAPLTLAAAEAVGRIPRSTVPDMPDRIIAATALHLGLPLVTRDRKIRAANVQTVW